MAEAQLTPTFGNSPFHPDRHFKFPVSEIQGKKRRAQIDWFHDYKWLHYEVQLDKVFCYFCGKAFQEQKLLLKKNTDLAFISKGFNNWKKAHDRFKAHIESENHKEAISKLQTNEVKDIGEVLSKEHMTEKAENRKYFMKVVSTIRYLVRQNIPLRGHDSNNSNFLQLMKLRAEDMPEINDWLEKKIGKYVHHEVQNEIIDIMAKMVEQKVLEPIQMSDFSLMCDETTDSANLEQAVIVLRWVDDETYEISEDFVGLRTLELKTGEAIFQMIKSALDEFLLNFSQVKGQNYDGAYNMSGSKKGVSALVQEVEPRAIYIHCNAHSLNLGVSDAIKGSKKNPGSKVLRDALDNSNEVIKLIKLSPKREAILSRIKDEADDSNVGINTFCPTRWTVKAAALNSIIVNYKHLIETFEESKSDTDDTELKARLNGVIAMMQKFEYYFGIELGLKILRHTDNLSKALQKREMSASEGKELAMAALSTLESFISDDEYEEFWESVISKTNDLEIEEPKLPRKRKKPARYSDGESFDEESFLNVKTY